MNEKQKLWAWLKAENRYKPPKPTGADAPVPAANRASRRRSGKRVKSPRGGRN